VKIKCKTCTGSCVDLKERIWCLRNGRILWTPIERIGFCEGCNMYYTRKGITPSGERVDIPACARHAEPCWKNTRFDKHWNKKKKKHNFLKRYKKYKKYIHSVFLINGVLVILIIILCVIFSL